MAKWVRVKGHGMRCRGKKGFVKASQCGRKPGKKSKKSRRK